MEPWRGEARHWKTIEYAAKLGRPEFPKKYTFTLIMDFVQKRHAGSFLCIDASSMKLQNMVLEFREKYTIPLITVAFL